MGKANKKENIHSIPDVITMLTLLKLADDIENLKNRHKKTCEMAVRSILHALDFKDHYTYGHSMRVAFYCLTLGNELNFNDEEMYDLELASLFHDIGKIGVPDTILLKPSRLNEEEFRIMKSHPEKSYEILKDFKDFEKIAHYVRHHHERWDGKGYPYCLQKEDIPYFSRIILIADTFDAMTSTRPYRKGLSYEVAFQELLECSGTQFDPYLVRQFIKAMRKDKERQEKTFYLKILGEQIKKDAA